MHEKMFETASFHIVKPCNMSCKFCYATFNDMSVLKQIPKEEVYVILERLKNAGLQKITFAGGEPFLYRDLLHVLDYAKYLGLTTSIITNGYFLDEKTLIRLKNLRVDWIGISIDSLNSNTNKLIGRESVKPIDYYELVNLINRYDFKLKINTVVNKFNESESMQKFIDFANPARWKIFDTLRVEGQNDKQFDEIKTSWQGFNGFVLNHKHPSMVVENNKAMTGSYLLIDPQGRLFENSEGKHTYSDKLQDNSIEHCLTQINLNREAFINRGGVYKW